MGAMDPDADPTDPRLDRRVFLRYGLLGSGALSLAPGAAAAQDRTIVPIDWLVPDPDDSESGDSGGNEDGQEVVQLPSTVETKRELIDDIRTTAGRLLPGETVDGFDRTAFDLLEEIEDDFRDAGATRRGQYEEALERMVLAEEVTLAATESGIEPTRQTVRAVINLGLSKGIGRVAKGTLKFGGWAVRRLRSMISGIAALAGRTIDRLIGRPLLSPAARREVDDVMKGISTRIAGFWATFGEDLRSVGEKLLSKPIKNAADLLPAEARAALENIRDEAWTRLVGYFYGRYHTRQKEVTDDGVRVRPAGINTAIENHTSTLADLLEAGELDGDGHEERESVSSETIGWIQWFESGVLNVMEKAFTGIDIVSMFSIVAAFFAFTALIAGALMSATGIGIAAGAIIATLGVKLKSLAIALGKITVILTISVIAVGMEFLARTGNRHDRAVERIVTFEGTATEVQ